MGRLQQALTALTDCSAQEWQLGISMDKCCVLIIEPIHPHLFISNHELDVVLQARDLGILVSDCLSRLQLHTYLILLVKLIGVLNSFCVHSPHNILDYLYVHTSFM